MGKKNFSKIYSDACDNLGLTEGTIKLSNFCSEYEEGSNYAGIIFYHHKGKYKWTNTKGVARGYRCQSFYVLIQCTDLWEDSDFRRAGQGFVHDKMYQDMFGYSYDEKRSCCGGFAIMEGERKYSSYWLNDQSSQATRLRWQSDGDRNLSKGEKIIVDLAIDAWIREGANSIQRISKRRDSRIRSAA
jgi:hypothetical protein